MSEERDPLLIFPTSVHATMQREAMDVHAGTGHELMACMLLEQAWQDDREVLQPTVTFVPSPADLRYQEGEGVALGQSAADKLWRHMIRTNTHLFQGHAHPNFEKVGFSSVDVQADREESYQLGAINGGRVLVSAVFDHAFSLRTPPAFAHWLAGVRRNMEVVHPDRPVQLKGRAFTRVGMKVSGIHRCPRQRWISPVVEAGMRRPIGQWTGTLLPGPDQSTRILADTPGDQVLIKITTWPWECDCYLQKRDKSSILLAELGYYDSQPWGGG